MSKQTSDKRSYFLIDLEDENGGRACGPFDTVEEVEGAMELVSNVKRCGFLIITECDRIPKLEVF